MKAALFSVAALASAMVGVVDSANACSLRPGYAPFVPRNGFRFSESPTPAPQVRVDEIRRGHSGTPDACDNWGVVVVEVPVLDAGYSFEIVESSEPGLRFPDGFVRPNQGRRSPARLWFYWNDGATNEPEPIEVLVKITAMSSGGVQSQPKMLKIEHAGVSATR